MPGALQQAEHSAGGIFDHDAIPQDDRQERRRRHRVSVADLAGDESGVTLASRRLTSPARPPAMMRWATARAMRGADVIVSGREPRRRSQAKPGRLIWLLVVAQAAAL